MENVEKIVQDIKEMRIQGAVNIALAAVKALESLVESSSAKTKGEFLKELEYFGGMLKNARPSAVALPNAVNLFLNRVEEIEAKDLETLKRKTLEIGNELIRKTRKAVENIGERGSKLVKDNSVVLTHCHSSTVMTILKKAWKSGKKFEVICTETRPWHQGFISAKELSEAGIPTTLIVDSAVTSFMKKVNLVLVGADTITKNFEVVNKIGTSQIAIIAKEFKVPFYIAAQELKFSRKTKKEVIIEERPLKEIIDPKKLPKVKIRNPVFDFTSKEYIKGIITEKGIKKF